MRNNIFLVECNAISYCPICGEPLIYRKRYNDIFRVQIPNITPHVCRHIYCSNMAKSGISVKILQYLMGHSDIATTLNVYTHLKLEDVQDELEKLKMKEQIKKEMALLDMEEAMKELRKVSSV